MATVRYLLIVISLLGCFCNAVQAEDQAKVPVLTYHRFSPAISDGMTVTPEEFESHVKWLKEHNYTVIPLRTLVNYLEGNGPAPPPKSVVITADDGHISVFNNMQPIVKKYNIPVTLFLYPSCISNASYAMTWDQIQKLQQTGLFDVQGHTYWHPNFKREKKKLSPEEYQKLVETQLVKSKSVLDKKLNINVDLLAWPFGIYDDQLESEAQKAGYKMAFSIDAHCAKKSEKMMAMPRYMVMHSSNLKNFEAIMNSCVDTAPTTAEQTSNTSSTPSTEPAKEEQKNAKV